jgi:nucleotide-binding universal stress UspA family protein
MYSKVMVAIDGSETAQEALKQATTLINASQGALCIVNVVSESGDTAPAKELLEQTKASVSGAFTVETRLLEADPTYGLNGIAEVIAAAASEWGAELLAVGTSNRRGMERFLMGSVAEQLVAKVDASILLVRPRN